MPNVHRIGDYQSASQEAQARQQQNNAGYAGPRGAGGAPAMYGPFKEFLAPSFKKKSFIFVITVIQVIVFIAMLITAQIKYGYGWQGAFVKCNQMGGPAGAVEYLFGAKWVPAIQDGQVFRFITPVFLHGGILHIFMNLVFQSMLCYDFEREWGTKRMICVYFATGFGATLLACVGSPGSLSVGASGALFGCLGVGLAYLILNWNDLPVQMRAQRLCTLICIIIINFIFALGFNAQSSGGGSIDNFAHLGGLISGIFIGLSFGKTLSDPPLGCNRANGTVLRRIGIGLTLIYFATTLSCTFFAVTGSSADPLTNAAFQRCPNTS